MRMQRVPLFTALTLAACTDAVTFGEAAWQAQLVAPPGGITGSVAAVSQSNRTDVSIAIQRAVSGQQYAWRIQRGDCQTEGVTLGGSAIYPNLVANDAGSAEARAVLSQALGSGPYAARVYLVQPGGGQAQAACGVLQRS